MQNIKPITVLSLFDGISCGQQALKELGISVRAYYASEIHLPSIKITQKNFPNTIQLGDIQRIKWLKHFPKIDLFIGGSPCQGFSFTGKMENFDHPGSKLFYEYIRLKKECKPKNFLLENVRMQKESEAVITKYMNVKPVKIQSALVSAQTRFRLYWCNWLVQQPVDQKIFLSSVLQQPWIKLDRNAILTNRCNFNNFGQIKNNPAKQKANCLLCDQRSNHIATSWKTARELFPIEAERLQGLPDNYTEGISTNQRHVVLGNGWNVQTIKHIFKQLYK